MTDARLQGHWLNDPVFEGLSDRAWRTFTGSLLWCAEHGTDGKLTARSLRLIHPDGTDNASANALVTAGKWIETDAGYEVADWPVHQSLAADVAHQRDLNRQRQAKWRASQRGESPVTDDVTRYVTDDVTREITRESLRQGQDRQGSSTEPKFYETSAGESEQPTLDEIAQAGALARGRGCQDCQRVAATTAEPCPAHRAVSA